MIKNHNIDADILQKDKFVRITIKIQKFSIIIQQQRNNQRFIFIVDFATSITKKVGINVITISIVFLSLESGAPDFSDLYWLLMSIFFTF